MGQIVGAALVSHQPGPMQSEEFRRLQGAGEDSSLIAGCARRSPRRRPTSRGSSTSTGSRPATTSSTAILRRWNDEYRRLPWEAFGAHCLQLLGALGGAACRARGERLSDHENARGTRNVHVWFDLAGGAA